MQQPLPEKVVFTFDRVALGSTCVAAAGNSNTMLHIPLLYKLSCRICLVQMRRRTHVLLQTIQTIQTPTRRHKLDNTTVPTRSIPALIHLQNLDIKK